MTTTWAPSPPENAIVPPFEYRGELSEFDVLGVALDDVMSEANIQRALEAARQVRLRANSSILVIQSGAVFPDGAMLAELQKNFSVVPFSGIPPIRRTSRGVSNESGNTESFSRSLRLAAAHGGNDFILCYWGILESENEHLATKTISWAPVVRWVLPDERQHMRIRVKLALIDVRSGNWSVFSPKPIENRKISTAPHREVVDQKQIEALKQEVYKAAVSALISDHSELALAR
jgi:hypothetical protein